LNEPDFEETINSKSVPFLIDTNGDRLIELMYVENGKRKLLWIEEGDIKEDDFRNWVLEKPEMGCLEYSQVEGNEFMAPHSNSFLDINGDCAADLFINSLRNDKIIFETWLREQQSGKFCLVQVQELPYKNISLVTFGDMSNNGMIDIVFAEIPEDPAQPMDLRIVYNQIHPKVNKPCSSVQNSTMTVPFTPEGFEALTSIDGVVLIIPVDLPESPNPRFFHSQVTTTVPRLRLGDINIDGFQDVLLVVSDQNKTGGKILLGMNQDGLINFDPEDSDNQEYYTIISDSVKSISDYNVLSASFFDFDEIGNLGIWAVAKGDSSSATKLEGFFNFVSNENFFLKTLGLNGFNADNNITNDLGGIYYGPSIEMIVTDLNGNQRLSKGVQLPQSAYSPLDVPYMFIGLGRTNNYIENFNFGIPKAFSPNDIQKKEWTPIIPNSQLIINPIRDGEWVLNVYVNPTSQTLLIVFGTLAILIVLGTIIVYLHRKEKIEDEKNRDVLLHVFG